MDIRDPEYSFDTDADKNTQTPSTAQAVQETGDIEYLMDVYEYAPYQRSAYWTKLMILIILLLSALAFWIDGWGSVTMLFAFIVLAAIYLKTHQNSDSSSLVKAAVAKYGLLFGGKMYPYAKMSGYYFLFFPEYITLNCHMEGKFSGLVTIYLRKDEDVEQLRNALQGKVSEEFDVKENPVQKLIRLLQL